MRTRATWFLLGCLTAGIAAYASVRYDPGPELSSEQRHVLAEYGFEPIERVETIEVPVEVPVDVVVRERFEVEVPGEPVEVVRYRDRPETECSTFHVEPSGETRAPPKFVEIGGTCEIDVVGDMARAWWSCRVDSPDQGWDATRGPEIAQEVRFTVAKAAQEPRYRRHAWLGPWKAPAGWGGVGGLSLTGRKWGLWAGAGLLPVESESVETVFSDGEPVDFVIRDQRTYEPSFGVMVGRRF